MKLLQIGKRLYICSMTALLLSQLYQDKSKLNNVSIEELRTLVVRYPYFRDLREFLAIKSLGENLDSQSRDTSMAALTSPNRSRLFSILNLKKKDS